MLFAFCPATPKSAAVPDAAKIPLSNVRILDFEQFIFDFSTWVAFKKSLNILQKNITMQQFENQKVRKLFHEQ